MTLETTNREPSLGEILNSTIDTKLKGINISMPAIIQSYDKVTKLVEVQPSLKIKLKDKPAQNLPLLQSVPVVWPRNEFSGIYFPLKKGDSCLLVFSQRALDSWLTSGGVVDPSNKRKFSLSDAVAIVGMYPTAKQLPLDFDDLDKMVLINQKTKITLDSNGKISLGKVGSLQEEPLVLGNVLSSFLTEIIEILKYMV